MELYWLVIFTAIINSIGWIMYIKDTLTWKTKPNRVTWSIWAAAPLIAVTATFYSEWLVWSAVPVFMAWLIPLLILLASFVNKQSYWKLSTLDYFCLVFALLALILWWITDSPLLAIIFSIWADTFAAIPLLIKMYQFPETETITPFAAGLIANSTGLLAVKAWVMEEYLFPLYLVIICSVIIWTYYYSLKFRKTKK